MKIRLSDDSEKAVLPDSPQSGLRLKRNLLDRLTHPRDHPTDFLNQMRNYNFVKIPKIENSLRVDNILHQTMAHEKTL
jgi:hypothetical protein